MSTKQTTVDTYNASARAIAAHFDSFGARAKDIAKAFELLGPREHPSVVEIGCGSGRDAPEILKYADDYVGIDISSELLRIARESVPGARFEEADLEAYEFPKRVDLIFAFASLLHSPKEKVEEFLRKARAALTDGGILYVSLKRDDYSEKTQGGEWGERTFYLYTPELLQELAGSGLETVWLENYTMKNTEWFTIGLKKARP